MAFEMTYSIDCLEVADNPIVLFRGIVGSRAYGTQNANRDTDVRGIFVVPSAEYARLVQPPKQVSDERNDRTYYSLIRFCELMAEANPTTTYNDEIMAFADAKKSVIEAGKGSLPPDCDKEKVDELIASVMKEAGVS